MYITSELESTVLCSNILSAVSLFVIILYWLEFSGNIRGGSKSFLSSCCCPSSVFSFPFNGRLFAISENKIIELFYIMCGCRISNQYTELNAY